METIKSYMKYDNNSVHDTETKCAVLLNVECTYISLLTISQNIKGTHICLRESIQIYGLIRE